MKSVVFTHHIYTQSWVGVGETGGGGLDWIDLAQDMVPVAGSYEYGNEPSDSIICGDILE